MTDDELRWREVARAPAHDYRIFQSQRIRATHQHTGAEREFVGLHAPDWVNVIARTPAGDVVLIRQYRHGTAAVHVEIPGRMVDPGEAPLVAAQRELAEETGYASSTIALVRPKILQTPHCTIKLRIINAESVVQWKAISTEDAFKLPKAKNYFFSREYDGENVMLFFNSEKIISVNPGGTVRIGLPSFDEAVELLKKAEVGSCILGAEIYVKEDATAAHPVQQAVPVLRSPSSKAALEKLGLAIFDVIEFDGQPISDASTAFQLLDKWFAKGKLAHVVEFRQTNKIDELMTYFTEWVVGEGAEGVVVRHDHAGWFKI